MSERHNRVTPLPFPPLELFNPQKTITYALSTKTHQVPKSVSFRLFPKPFVLKRFYRRFFIKRDLLKGRIWTKEELDEAEKRANFPRRPSDLFLRIYADVLTCLSRDPLAGNVSPNLIGTAGTIPLSIVSTIPDIMMHYHDCIVLAEKEVFLVTNYWQPSDSVNTISSSLKELSVLIGERKSQKVVVKIIWDRGSPSQAITNHVRVSPQTWTKLDLPAPSEVPNLSLEVINYHRPLLGTFHQKAMVIDRKVAILNSNNIQDRPNVEMMVHLEGPIVDSIYDVLLLSWHESFNPSLPCLSLPSLYTSPPSQTPTHHFPQTDELYPFSDANPYLEKIDIIKAAKAARTLLRLQNIHSEDTFDPHAPGIGTHERERGLRMGSWRGEGGKFAELVKNMREKGNFVLAQAHHGNATNSTSVELENLVETQEKVTSHVDAHENGNGTSNGGVNGNSKNERLSVDDSDPKAGRALESRPSARLSALSKALNAGAKKKAEAMIHDESLIDDFVPHMIHKKHDLFPIALVNRKPHGLPGHQDVRVPQDAAWLAAFQYATDNVFIQTPTLNAKPIVRAIIAACTRDIQVTLYLDLGFNDKGESVPFQGGTNEEVVFSLYKRLVANKKSKNLHVYWYTGKDQVIPLNAVHKTRNCHVKFMSADGQIAILGNGNQDTQSWYHSQECNILVDDPGVVADLMHQLDSNQSTKLYGKVDEDGVWRDSVTKEALQAPEKVSCFSAIMAMI